MTSNTFKKRYYNHKTSFKDTSYVKSTELSKHIWNLKNKKRTFNIKWSILNMGVWASSCLGGGGAQYSLPEQANLTLIFFPKIVGEEEGRSPKKFSVHTPKKFPGHTYKHSTKFSRHTKKIQVIFAKKQKCFYDISKFFRNLQVLPEFRSDFCPTVKIWGGGTCPTHSPQANTPMILKQASSYRSGAKSCNLCLQEKLEILKGDKKRLLNRRCELFSKCCHRKSFSA